MQEKMKQKELRKGLEKNTALVVVLGKMFYWHYYELCEVSKKLVEIY